MLKKCALLTLLLINIAPFTNSQEIIYGTNNYIEYHVGTLPIILVASHGGDLEPSSLPTRWCGITAYSTDLNTVETTLEIKESLYELTGCYPHVIISNLKRTKLDPNRSLYFGTCGNEEAETAWHEFHDFIEDARNTANNDYNNQSFLVDVHGHSHTVQRIELGYLLSSDDLEESDNTLNTTEYIDESSIKNLALNNVLNSTHAEVLRGTEALGTLLTNENYPSVPSQSIPDPEGNPYFNGGYITRNHTSYQSDIETNGVQMELYYDDIRNSETNRKAFAVEFSDALIHFMDTFHDIDWNACEALSVINFSSKSNFEIYPNPISRGDLIHFVFENKSKYQYQLLNGMGQVISSGELSSVNNTLDSQNLTPGIYLIRLSDKKNSEVMMNKVVVQ